MSNLEKKINQLREMMCDSEYLVCMIGSGMQCENGYPLMQESDWAYEMEMKYGSLPEEILNTSFYSTRKERFFDFYKNEILSKDYAPNEAYHSIAELQKKGWVKSIITTGIYSLPQKAGCRDVIELRGSICNNFCGHCRKFFEFDYVKNSNQIPKCDVCGSTVRPGIYLYGEMIDNQVMTRAMEEVSKADMVLVCGGNLDSETVKCYISYFNGKKVAIINKTTGSSDEKADIVINDSTYNILPKLVN